MNIGLCMVIKNEAKHIVPCLSPIIDLFSQVVIIDTGSSDNTCDLIQTHLNIEPLTGHLSSDKCHGVTFQRNRGFDLLETPWIMTLDADERISRKQLLATLALNDKTLPAGLISAWTTYFGNNRAIKDYKLSLFRKGVYKEGLVHENVQPFIRRSGKSAKWNNLLEISHYPDPAKLSQKDLIYAKRLECAIQHEPDWLRYFWFRGYALYRQGQLAEAKYFLHKLHNNRPVLFPVESLNASMVLAAIYAHSSDKQSAEKALYNAINYYNTVSNDFEVLVNTTLLPWFKSALNNIQLGALDKITPYQFPY